MWWVVGVLVVAVYAAWFAYELRDRARLRDRDSDSVSRYGNARSALRRVSKPDGSPECVKDGSQG